MELYGPVNTIRRARDSIIHYVQPKAVLVHLMKKKKIHEIPIFEEESKNTNLSEHVPKFFVGKRLFTISGSKYSSEKLEKCDNLENSTSQYLNVSEGR